jgi:hypothetical protein
MVFCLMEMNGRPHRRDLLQGLGHRRSQARKLQESPLACRSGVAIDPEWMTGYKSRSDLYWTKEQLRQRPLLQSCWQNSDPACVKMFFSLKEQPFADSNGS